ncbi:hypothetical protein IEQ34_017901 [Dendrobium chrysotoxum]|uniref:RNase H type-1 domain-containing protein n=1 Tax=Dendrobium chrysotoxum TaxID=161865 RepID=A0AAV7GCR6_DENCH|nr:hypothetical protein IEQ34_017901 [Dendrobium chrysotoxum]
MIENIGAPKKLICDTPVKIRVRGDEMEFVASHWDVNQSSGLSANSWHPPPPEWYKVNIDGALNMNYGAAIGGVVCDFKGRFILDFRLHGIHWDAAQVEFMAFKALKTALKGYLIDAVGIIIEGDNKNIIKFLHKLYSKLKELEKCFEDHDSLFLRDYITQYESESFAIIKIIVLETRFATVSKKYPNEIWIGSEANGYQQKVEFENFPSFCSLYKMHGLCNSECFNLHPHVHNNKDMGKVSKEKNALVDQISHETTNAMQEPLVRVHLS